MVHDDGEADGQRRPAAAKHRRRSEGLAVDGKTWRSAESHEGRFGGVSMISVVDHEDDER